MTVRPAAVKPVRRFVAHGAVHDVRPHLTNLPDRTRPHRPWRNCAPRLTCSGFCTRTCTTKISPIRTRVTGRILNHFPELEVRRDVRRYLEFVSNRFGVNPQPGLSSFVEGRSELGCRLEEAIPSENRRRPAQTGVEQNAGPQVDLDTRVRSLDAGRTAGAGLEAEAGYGLWGGPVLGMVRPYVGLTRYPGEASIRRAVGLYLRDTPDTHLSVEAWDHSRHDSQGVGLRARLRF